MSNNFDSDLAIKKMQAWLDKYYPGCYVDYDNERNRYVVNPDDLFMKIHKERQL